MDNFVSNLIITEKKKVPKRTFIIEDVIVKDYDKMEPCLVEFSNGTVKKPENVKGKLFRNMSEIRRRSESILAASSDRLTYTGKNFGEDIDVDFKSRNFLGVLDKKTNKMKLIELSTFLLHPEYDTKEATTSIDTFISTLSQSDKRSQLSKTFGGRRGRAAEKKKEARKFDILDMSQALHNSTQKIETDDLEEELEETISYDKILPPCDRNANVIENVYKLADIIPDIELVLYNDEALEYMDGNKDSSGLSLLVRQTIANAKLSVKEEETAKLVCIALYVQNLLELLIHKGFRDPPKLKSCPKLMEKKIFSNFTEGNRKRKTKTLEDKLIAHIIILSFIANQYGLQWTTLCQSLSVKKERLATILNIIGAKVLKSKGSVLLQLPLVKNDSDGPNRRRKKRRTQ